MQELIINADKSHNSSIHNNSINTSLTVQRARLPPVTLPKFDGNIQDWESFFDCFKAMFHNEDIYPPAQKCSYLRSSLSGAALDIIKAIPMTDVNYAVAIRRLQQRYENKSMVIQSHIRAILDYPQMESTTAYELQALHSNVVYHVAALEALGQPIYHWNAWLVTILLRKVDHTTAHDWQLRRKDTEQPTYKELEEFLASRCVAFKSSESWHDKKIGPKKNMSNVSISKSVTLAATEDKVDKCVSCHQAHKIYACNKFKELPQKERFNMVRATRLCFNCLSPYHMAPACQSHLVCSYCKGKHNSLLHFDKQNQAETRKQNNSDKLANQPSASSPNNEQSQIHSCIVSKSMSTHVFLSTAAVLVSNIRGGKQHCRAVLDSGSMVNFISKGLLNKLQISTKKAELPVRGIGASRVHATATVNIQVSSRINKYETTLQCYVLLLL